MHTSYCKFVKAFVMCFILFFCCGLTCKAQAMYQNPQTGYSVAINDTLGLLHEQEREELLVLMEEVSAYGNVAFLTASEGLDQNQTIELAKVYYNALYKDADGVLFFIDMKSRYLYIYSHNKMSDVITKEYAETITDNVYKYAKNGEYGTCAIKAYAQILSLLQGHRIHQPMKYICNTLLGIMLAFLLSFFWILIWHKSHIPPKLSKMEGVKANVSFLGTYVVNKQEEKFYNPSENPERIYDEGDGSDGFGGGFGGGFGSSGSGGGHFF